VSASRRARLGRLRKVAQKRVLAAEVAVAAARGLLEQVTSLAHAAESEAIAALLRWTDEIASADELAHADARRQTLRKVASAAQDAVTAHARELAAREEVLVAERQGDMRLEKVLERLSQLEAARVATRERRAADEHAARLSQERLSQLSSGSSSGSSASASANADSDGRRSWGARLAAEERGR
jgi:hypothetical protein